MADESSFVRLRKWFAKKLSLHSVSNDLHDNGDIIDLDDDASYIHSRRGLSNRRHTFNVPSRSFDQQTDQQLMAAALIEDDQLPPLKTTTNRPNYCKRLPVVDEKEIGRGVRRSASERVPRMNTADDPLKNKNKDSLIRSSAVPALAPPAPPRQRKISATRNRGLGSGATAMIRRISRHTKVDVTRPLQFPATPEMILEYHQKKRILDENEEWLVVELNQFECLVDGIDVIRIIAKHSKFFEVGPAELCEEFFRFVDEVPSYDEVINFDVWQEFRDKKYKC